MIIAWVLFTSTGVLISRYYKFLIGDQRILKYNIWFALHAPVMILVALISIAALLIILSARRWSWVNADEQPLEFAHSIFGIVTIGLSVIQVALGLLRPSLEHPKRFIFNLVHRLFGISAFIFSGINQTS